MKKILAVLLAALAFSAVAQDKVTIVYGFSAADNSFNYTRNLAREANAIQKKYEFLVDAYPGGGQAVAVNHVKNNPNTIFMTSGAFWLRPNFYPKESWNVNDFRTIWTQCSVPFAIASPKYRTWSDVPKDKHLTIGTSGLGVVSHLVALQFQKKFPDSTIIPFKSTTEAIIGSVGGQVDFVVGFVGDMERWTGEDNKVRLNILGTTGPKPVGKFPNLSSQGFPASLAKMNTPYNFMVPSSFPEAKAKEIREILLKVENAKSVHDAYALDYCQAFTVPEKQLKSWFDEQNEYWTKLTVGVKLDQ